MSPHAVLWCAGLALAIPTATGLALVGVGSRRGGGRLGSWCAVGAAGVATLFAVRLVAAALKAPDLLPVDGQVAWLTSGDVRIAVGLHADAAAFALLLVAAAVMTAVLWYRAGPTPSGRDVAPAAVLLHGAAIAGLGLVSGLIPVVTLWLLGGLAAAVLVATGHPRVSALAAGRSLFLSEVVGVLGIGLATVVCHVTASPADPFAPATTPLAGAWPAGAMRSLAGAGLLLAAGSRASQLPLSWWLPRAAVAPPSARALLLGGLHGASGLVLMLRFSPLLDVPVRAVALSLGGLSLIVLATAALAQTSRPRAVGCLGAVTLAGTLTALAVGAPPRTVLVLMLSQLPALAILALLAAEALDRRVQRVAWFVAAAALAGVPGSGGFLAWRAVMVTLATRTSPLVAAFAALWLSRAMTVAVLVRWWARRDVPRARPGAAPRHDGALLFLAGLSLASLLGHADSGVWLDRLVHADPQALLVPPPPEFWVAVALTASPLLVGLLLGLWGRRRSPARGWPWPPPLRHTPARLRLLVAGSGPLATATAHALTAIAGAVAGFDEVVVVGVADGCGWIGRIAARLVAIVDRVWIEGSTRAAAEVVDLAGSGLQRLHTGRLRDGLILAVVAGIVLVLVAR